jgi:hypothetical protein
MNFAGTLQYEHNQYNTDKMKNTDSGMMPNSNADVTDHNPECSSGAQNYSNNQNAEPSRQKNVYVSVKRKVRTIYVYRHCYNILCKGCRCTIPRR